MDGLEEDENLTDLTRSFPNDKGGIIAARKLLESYKQTLKPFLEKHPEYIEDYSFDIGEMYTKLHYRITKKDGSEENRGDI